jgi:DNA polymerase III psi subunit
MKLNFLLPLVSICLFLLSSCSIYKNNFYNDLYINSNETLKEANLSNLRFSLPSQIKLLEEIYRSDPHNLVLKALLAKSYLGHALAINETDLLEENWQNRVSNLNERSVLNATILNETKALGYGISYLSEIEMNWDDLIKNSNDKNWIISELDKKIGIDKMSSDVLLTVNVSLSSLIKLQKEKVEMISLLPLNKIIYDWICSKNIPESELACQVFYGVMAAKPKSLGGNIDKAKELFTKAINQYPELWPLRIEYCENILIPYQMEKELDEQFKFFNLNDELFFRSHFYMPFEKRVESGHDLYKAIALKRFEILKKYRKQLFK